MDFNPGDITEFPHMLVNQITLGQYVSNHFGTKSKQRNVELNMATRQKYFCLTDFFRLGCQSPSSERNIR